MASSTSTPWRRPIGAGDVEVTVCEAPLVSTTRAIASSSTMYPMKSVCPCRCDRRDERSAEAEDPVSDEVAPNLHRRFLNHACCVDVDACRGRPGCWRWSVEPSVKSMEAPLTAKAVRSVAVTLTSELRERKGTGAPGDVEAVTDAESKQRIVEGGRAGRTRLAGDIRVPRHTRMHTVQLQAFARPPVERRPQAGTTSVRGVGPDGDVHETETAAELAKVQVAVFHGNGHGGWSDVFDEQLLDPKVHRVLDEQRMSCVASHVAVKATNVTRIGLNVIGAEVVEAGLLSRKDTALTVVRCGCCQFKLLPSSMKAPANPFPSSNKPSMTPARPEVHIRCCR